MAKMTIADIAQLAGVSKATVSRVLNNNPDVDPATRKRILRIMQERRFVRNVAADMLARGKNRLVGLVVPSLTWPLMSEVIRGVAEVLNATSYEMILYSISHEDKDRTAVIDRILATKLTSGLLAMFPGQSAQHLAEIHAPDFPVVMIDDQGLPTSSPWVGADNRIGAYEATQHLIKLGHRRIAHLHGPQTYQCSHDRYQGYRDALADAGIPADAALVFQGDFESPSGNICAQQIFSLPDAPTAIFAGNDLMAYGVLEAAEQRGIRIPEDVALVGFDDTPSSFRLRPSLTTVRQPFYEMAQHATGLLLSLIEPPPASHGWQSSIASYTSLAQSSPHVAEPVRVYFPTALVIRESSVPRDQSQASHDNVKHAVV
jgi:LacI family transcriptional regulator